MTHCLNITLVFAFVLLVSLKSPAAFADQAPSLDNYQQLVADFGSADMGVRANAQTTWQNVCFELSRIEYETTRVKACEQMCASLATDQSLDATLFILRQLERIGGAESVATLQPLAGSENAIVADAARRALQNNTSDSALDALVQLTNAAVNEESKIAFIHSLGYRAEQKSETVLAALLENGSPAVQVSASQALSRLDSESATETILAAWRKASVPLVDQLAESLIVIANRLANTGKPIEAVAILRDVYDRSENPAVRAAALKGQLSNNRSQIVELIVKALNGDSVLEQQVAIGQVCDMTPEDTSALVNRLTEVPPSGRASLLIALGSSRVTSALPAIEQASKSNDLIIKTAAITALGQVGNASHTSFLLDQLSGSDELQSAAGKSLAIMFDDDVDTILLKRLEGLDNEAQQEQLISILSARNCPALAQFIVNTNALVSPNADTRKRASGILNRLGTAGHVPALITSMTQIPASEKDGFEKTIVSICSRIPNADAQAAPVANMYASASNEQRPNLLSVAGRIGGKAASDFISSKIASSSAAEKDAAITAICNWPDDSVIDQLMAIAQSGDSASQRIRAIRAIARVVVLPTSKHSLDEQLSLLQQTMELTTQDDERKLILDRAKAIGLLSSVEFMRRYIQNPTLGQQAESSLVHLARIRELRQADPSIRVDLERVLETSSDTKLRERAKQFLLEY
jgi:HEAT repeat protein